MPPPARPYQAHLERQASNQRDAFVKSTPITALQQRLHSKSNRSVLRRFFLPVARGPGSTRTSRETSTRRARRAAIGARRAVGTSTS